MRFVNTLLAVAMAMATVVTAVPTSSNTTVSSVNSNTTITVVHITTEVSVFDPKDGVSGIEADGTLLVEADNAGCPRATRYACGQYMLADGTRQDFVSQVFNCIARDKFICQKFDYQLSHPTHPGEASYMVAAKIDPGCTCTFYRYIMLCNVAIIVILIFF
jgi:hypothetical protein